MVRQKKNFLCTFVLVDGQETGWSGEFVRIDMSDVIARYIERHPAMLAEWRDIKLAAHLADRQSGEAVPVEIVEKIFVAWRDELRRVTLDERRWLHNREYPGTNPRTRGVSPKDFRVVMRKELEAERIGREKGEKGDEPPHPADCT